MLNETLPVKAMCKENRSAGEDPAKRYQFNEYLRQIPVLVIGVLVVSDDEPTKLNEDHCHPWEGE